MIINIRKGFFGDHSYLIVEFMSQLKLDRHGKPVEPDDEVIENNCLLNYFSFLKILWGFLNEKFVLPT